MMDEFNFAEFERKLKAKLVKLGFNKKWLDISNYVDSLSSRELHDIDKTADEIIKNKKERKKTYEKTK